MKIKKEMVEKDFNYLNASFPKINPQRKHVSIFVAMLFALLSSSSIYATSQEMNVLSQEAPSGFTSVCVPPMSHNPMVDAINTAFGILQWSTLIVTTIALITTIVYGVKMQIQKKKENPSLEKTKKKFKISIITFAVCFLLFIVEAIIGQYIITTLSPY